MPHEARQLRFLLTTAAVTEAGEQSDKYLETWGSTSRKIHLKHCRMPSVFHVQYHPLQHFSCKFCNILLVCQLCLNMSDLLLVEIIHLLLIIQPAGKLKRCPVWFQVFLSLLKCLSDCSIVIYQVSAKNKILWLILIGYTNKRYIFFCIFVLFASKMS